MLPDTVRLPRHGRHPVPINQTPIVKIPTSASVSVAGSPGVFAGLGERYAGVAVT
jgi:hypothetical protein